MEEVTAKVSLFYNNKLLVDLSYVSKLYSNFITELVHHAEGVTIIFYNKLNSEFFGSLHSLVAEEKLQGLKKIKLEMFP